MPVPCNECINEEGTGMPVPYQLNLICYIYHTYMRSCQRKNNRCLNFNYDSEGCYFITICIKDRYKLFGKIENNNMYLSDFGIMANVLWNEIPIHYSDIKLDEYIVMPDHIHGILFIVGNSHACSLPTRKQNQKLSIVIGSYKSAISKEINKIISFEWQKSFFDKIVRSEKEYLILKKYIKENSKEEKI